MKTYCYRCATPVQLDDDSGYHCPRCRFEATVQIISLVLVEFVATDIPQLDPRPVRIHGGTFHALEARRQLKTESRLQPVRATTG